VAAEIPPVEAARPEAVLRPAEEERREEEAVGTQEEAVGRQEAAEGTQEAAEGTLEAAEETLEAARPPGVAEPRAEAEEAGPPTSLRWSRTLGSS
jgi:hypothetical protein